MSGHHEESAFIAAPPSDVFAFIDDHSRLSSHMARSSWMMGGGRMSIATDNARGQAVRSHIRLTGRVFGLRVFLDQVVTRRVPPREKVWQTVGTPKLLVIGRYRMGIAIRACNSGSELRVFIDYELPVGLVTRWLGRMFGGIYAKWCVEQMLTDARNAFTSKPAAAAA